MEVMRSGVWYIFELSQIDKGLQREVKNKSTHHLQGIQALGIQLARLYTAELQSN